MFSIGQILYYEIAEFAKLNGCIVSAYCKLHYCVKFDNAYLAIFMSLNKTINSV